MSPSEENERTMPAATPRNYRQLLDAAAAHLAGVSETPRLDAELLLGHTLDRPRAHLRAWPESRPDSAQLVVFEKLLARRRDGEPMAYILGTREFWSMELKVTPDTLIPRPDTEILVETALEKIPSDQPCRVLDLGTGSGAIALALKQERPLADVLAGDVSGAALEVARDNARRLALDVEFREGSWWAPFEGMQFDVAVSNPPYISESDAHLKQGDLRFEPRTALASGNDGLDDIRALLTSGLQYLAPGGWLLIEHGYDQAAAVTTLFTAAGFENAAHHNDLAGHPRVSYGRRPALK